MGILVAVVILAAAGAAYRYSIWRRPTRPCRRCGGNGRNTDTNLFRGASGRCWRCKGRGQRVRWGVRVLAPSTYESIQSGETGKNF